VKKPEGKSPLGRPRRRWEDVLNVWDGEDWSHLPEDRDKLWVQVNMLMQFRVVWKCGECLYQLIMIILSRSNPPSGVSQSVSQTDSQSVSLSLQATTAVVCTRHAHASHLKPCISAHKQPIVTLCRIPMTCRKCRCSQRILLPKWGYIRRYCANGPHGSVHGCAWRTVTFQQLYESTVSFCALSSIQFTSTLYCCTTLGGTNRKRFKHF